MSLNLIHILGICAKKQCKSESANRISSLLDPENKKTLFNAARKSHFNYCPLIWMFSSRKSNNLIKFTKGL